MELFCSGWLFHFFVLRICECGAVYYQATRAYLHAESDVEASLKAAGFEVVKREMTSTQFYFSRLLEAKRVSA